MLVLNFVFIYLGYIMIGALFWGEPSIYSTIEQKSKHWRPSKLLLHNESERRLERSRFMLRVKGFSANVHHGKLSLLPGKPS